MNKIKVNFKNAYIKLTLFYVLIVMAISVSFSLVLFNISSQELDRSLGRQVRVFSGIAIQPNGNQKPDFEQIRIQQLEEGQDSLKMQLIYANLLILLLSTGLSYFLAQKTLEPMEESMEAQNRFTADASHELRTPLTAMKTEIEVNLMDDKISLSSAKKVLQSNLEEITKLEELSNSLLKLARSEGNNDFASVSLEDAIVEAYERVEMTADAKRISFKNDLKEVVLTGDKSNLIELFVILLDNAIKYSPEKSTIHIQVEKSHDHALVKVKDEGIGIKASDIPHIFDRFYRADTSRSKEQISGYGLGLSIAKKIVDMHNGTIAVSSKPGKGSEFVIKFPLK